jgi:actin-like ATPase involved in cell morphogenesis
LKPDGEFVVGEAAERRGLTEPDRLAREFKRRIGDHVPIMVAGTPFSPQALTSHLLHWVVDRATERMGEGPAEVILTHPANWGSFRLELFDQVAAMAGLTSARRCTEPEAAAVQHAFQTRVAPGDKVAVYDLGGGTFDACVLEKTDTGFRILGTAEGVEHLGGVDFDEAVLRHVLRALGPGAERLDPDDPEVTVGLARLRRDCVEAKEALSADVDTLVPVTLSGLSTTVRVTRAELEQMIRPALTETIAAMGRALRSAHVEPSQLRSILLVGGSSRIPLVSEMLHREFAVPTALDTHPKHDVALGAVRIGREDTDTLPGILLPMERPIQPEPAATTPGTTATPATTAAPPATASATTAGWPSSSIAGSTSIEEPPDGAPTADSTREAEKETTGPAREEVEANTQPAGRRRRLSLMAAAAAALVVLLATTLILVLRDPEPQSAATSPTATPTPSRSAAVKPLIGTYTWASGVRLTVSFAAERFGARYPYCEDGSCGFAEEDDIRVLLTYKVSVPNGLRDRVDPAACPGGLTTTRSAPTDPIRAIPDSYARPIATISAGQTRTGVLEYSIAEELRGAEFRLSSACGDVPRVGEMVVFRGPLPELRREEAPGDVGDEPINRNDLELRVDQVRTDLDGRTYAALVEVCARQTLSGAQRRRVLARSSWYLTSRIGWTQADDERQIQLPVYPYGSLRRGSCASGWMTFDLNRDVKPQTIVYENGPMSGVWQLAKGDSAATAEPEATKSATPRPPERGSESRPNSDPPSTLEPTESPTPQPPSSTPSSDPSVDPSVTPS